MIRKKTETDGDYYEAVCDACDKVMSRAKSVKAAREAAFMNGMNAMAHGEYCSRACAWGH